MHKSLSFYCFIIFLDCLCNLKNVFSDETIPVRLNFRGKYTSGVSNYEIVIPQRVNEDGSFISHLVSHRHSKRSTKELEYIFYKIPIGGKDYLIELTPNRKLISPGAVIEIHKENVRKSTYRKSLNESSNNETVDEMFRNLDVQKLKNTDCHFSGTVKGENVSKAALSTCYGLAGFIQITQGFYTIEPVAEHDYLIEDSFPHILYKTDEWENSSVCHKMGELSASLARKRRESNNFGLSLPLFVETLIVMDKALINYYRETDCENYILTVFNMADNLFHDASSGLMLALTVVRIIRLEFENDEMNLKVNTDAEKTLKYFQTWQYEMNPGDDTHPNHHDVAVLITKVNVCYSSSSCGLLGLTTIGKACDPKLSAALCEDNGLRLGYVIAHEIGHLLGADHDSENSTCNGTDANGLKTLMHPEISMTAQTWSACSQAYFKAFFSSGMGNCFFDEPEEHHFNVQDLLPGVMYNADFQCKHLITKSARECDMGSTCDSLNCYVPGYACILTHIPPAAGTNCGENMWCHNSKCLVVGERPGAIDGSWGEWSAWSECSRTCGSGVASSVRNCDKPQPSHGGKNCVGERKRYKICAATEWQTKNDEVLGNLLTITTVPQNISDLITFISEEINVSFVGKPCETGQPSFRDIQCGEFNDWIYPEDNKVHTWMAYFSHDDNPCILYCVNEEKQVAALKPRVVDGTMCFRGIRDICVGGICKSLPCDLYFESNAVEDACGVCHGDGTGCEFSEGTETLSKFPKGLTKLVNIPSGTRNIKVEELSPTSAKIIVRDKDTKEIYVRGSLGMFSVPGSQAWLGMIKKNQEALNIPGPVTKPLAIWIQRLDNVTVKWSMALPAEQQRKPEFAWDFLRWGPCSAKCGPGTQISKPSCMEGKAGLVEDSFCADLEVPPTKVRQCEVAKCESRWMVGDWKDCELINSKKERRRIVYCIKPFGEGEGESQIVSDSECIAPKPHERELCENRKKRENGEDNFENFLDNFYPRFTSVISEFGFRNKHENYLKHFAPISAPQRNSETIPLHLVFFPLLRNYFPGIETHEESEIESISHEGANSPNGTETSDVRLKSYISPSFYKKTLKGQRVSGTHFWPSFQESLRSFRQMKGRHSNFPSAETHSDILLQLRQNGKGSQNRIRYVKEASLRQKRKKHLNYNSPNLTKITKEGSRFANLLKKCRMMNEMTKPLKFPHERANRQTKHSSPFSKRRGKSSETSDFLKTPNMDGSSARMLALMYLKNQKKVKTQKHSNKRKSKLERLIKRKRSSRIWKKPKSKDGNSGGNACGSETKNYLNNLFRDNHPKTSTLSNKPSETQATLEKPVIKEGVLVIDKDSIENQEVEVLFDAEESEKRRAKFVKLPEYERKATLKGQDVFNLFQELQNQGGHSAYYRLKENPSEKLEINIKVPETVTKAEGGEEKKSTSSDGGKTPASTEAQLKKEQTSETATEKRHEEKGTTTKTETTTGNHEEKSTKKPFEIISEGNNQTTTSIMTTAENDSNDSECGVDEVIPESEQSTSETTTESKKKKKKEKEKKKKEKEKEREKEKEKKKKKKKEKLIDFDLYKEEREKYNVGKLKRWYHDGL